MNHLRGEYLAQDFDLRDEHLFIDLIFFKFLFGTLQGWRAAIINRPLPILGGEFATLGKGYGQPDFLGEVSELFLVDDRVAQIRFNFAALLDRLRKLLLAVVFREIAG